ncbi:MAG: T9SS type A sorting domain-containing protein [Candidatus Marinimicrobia bacterium]|jgi:hypothetical protein|nr:T9SS type A sorting domain-containing protein [Candidatus Neomarinimicrobiota bacterium]MBT4129687.1 T9SS type A sorting domain-containing protein [Candidatus Neomarinimicrobiota bacterium]MBT4294745.1 T9SS type A sorting domain-containing protein [Candidatus Neomarinimicrobiota bacterium]MBT4418928.1 T9SS type A sorting domain-containing protein [Candidatus Neomarinimicrobiota bacterium]MBT4993340.1 T9SS type A sorting domain-containing protein [Candidatus Neomarinimicrobiota bacterium]
MKNFNMHLIFGVALMLTTSAHCQWEYPGDVTLIGSEETVFDWESDSCEWDNTPDTPPRAWRGEDGNISLTIGHYVTYRMIGPDFNSLSIDCSAPISQSDYNESEPAQHNDHEWLSSTYTEDGITVHGIVHNEYHGFTSEECPDPADCAYTSLTYAVSTNSGLSFTHPTAPDHVVIAVDTATAGNRFGVIEPTNIIKHEGYYYFIAEAWGTDVQRAPYVFRTATISDPQSWRGWDGENYSVLLGNPYSQTVDYSQLTPVNKNTPWEGNIPFMHGSLTYNTYFEKFMLIGTTVKGSQWGIYYSLSEDLINWTQRILVRSFDDASVGQGDPSGTSARDHIYYATIIDHNDTSRNFEYSGQTVFLYYMRRISQSAAGANYQYDRKLIRQEIQFSKRLVDGIDVHRMGDQEDTYPGDGIAKTASGYSNLRAALMESRYRPPYYADSVMTIRFDITVTNHTTTPASYYLGPTFPVIIDGTTDPTYSANSNDLSTGMNTVFGAEIAGEYAVINLEGGKSGIRGVKVTAISMGSDSNFVEACDVGSIDLGATSGNRVGGSLEQRNRVNSIVINGTGDGNSILGNYIGCDLAGEISAGSSQSGVGIRNGATNTVISGNLISGSGFAGIEVSDSTTQNITISGNWIGTNSAGTGPLGNAASGVRVYNDVAGLIISDNIISGNNGEAGIFAFDISDVIISGNYIGCAPDASAIGNLADGIWLTGTSFDNIIGGPNGGNTIANNGGSGISLLVLTGNGNSILGNSIFNNVNQGIGNLTHVSVSTPNLNSAIINLAVDSVTVSGSYTNSDIGIQRVEFFGNSSCDGSGAGEGETYLGFTTLLPDSNGSGQFSTTQAASLSSGEYLTATLTNGDGSSSGFSNCRVTFMDAESPQISVSSETVEFTFASNESPLGTENIVLYNSGLYAMEWSYISNVDWLLLEPSSGSINPSDSAIVSISVNGSELGVGAHSRTINITSNAGNEPSLELQVSLVWGSTAGEPDLTILPNPVELSYQVSSTIVNHEENLSITNNGAESVNWFATSNQGWLHSLTPSNGSILPDGTLDFGFSIRVDQNLSVGTHTAYLVLHASHPNGENYPQEIIVTVTIGESGPNQPPIAEDLNLMTDMGIPVSFELLAMDPDGDLLSFNITTLPQDGSLPGDPPNLTYTPDPGFSGLDSFVFTVTDGEFSDTGAVYIMVNAVNFPPNAFNQISPNENIVLSLRQEAVISEMSYYWSSASDDDSDSITYLLELFAPGLEPLAFSTNDTVNVIDWTALNNLLLSIVTDTSRLTWSVIATDGLDTTTASNGPIDLQVVKWNIQLSEPELIGNDGTNLWFPGDTTQIMVTVSNSAPIALETPLSFNISTTSDGIEFLTAEVNVDSLGASGTEDVFFELIIAPSVPSNMEINFALDVATAHCQSYSLPICIDPITLDFSALVSEIPPTGIYGRQLPKELVLSPAFPNPFNPSTTIRYGIPDYSYVSLEIYDLRGNIVRTLESGQQTAGWYNVVWNGQSAEGRTISTGIYFARLIAGDNSQVLKLLYLK